MNKFKKVKTVEPDYSSPGQLKLSYEITHEDNYVSPNLGKKRLLLFRMGDAVFVAVTSFFIESTKAIKVIFREIM